MNKKKMIKEIIAPYMVANGLVLEEQKNGCWSWYKEIEGEDEYILPIRLFVPKAIRTN